MKGLREIKQRAKAVKNISQITRAMQLVAASKMKKAQDSAIGNRDYTLLLEEILSTLVDEIEATDHPLFAKRPVKTRGVILISTDRGLCGALNANLFRKISSLEANTEFLAIGKKASQYLARNNKTLLAEFTLPDPAPFTSIRPAIEYMLDLFYKGRIDTIEVAYSQYVNPLVQEPVIESLAPLHTLAETLASLRKRFKIKDDYYLQDSRHFILEPNAKAMISILPELVLRHGLYHSVLESRASEHSARMVAMKNATENANNLTDELTLEFNKARQAAITQEILEIASAAESAAA